MTFIAKNKRHRFCTDACRKIADQQSEAFKERQYVRSVTRHERRIQHQRRKRIFTAAVDGEIKQQAGVPRAAPRQFPPDAFSPEAIERYENARQLKQQEQDN